MSNRVVSLSHGRSKVVEHGYVRKAQIGEPDNDPEQMYITVWRKPIQLEWDYYISQDLSEAEELVRNIIEQKCRQYATYAINSRIERLSSKF